MCKKVILCLGCVVALSTGILCISIDIDGIVYYLLPIGLIAIAFLVAEYRLIFISFSLIVCSVLAYQVINNPIFYYPCFLTASVSLFKLGYYYSKERSEKRFLDLQKEVLYSRAMIIRCFNSAIDVDGKGLTKAELELLRQLCVYRFNNRELSLVFHKSESTVKSQLKSIMDKLGADSRFQLIEMCKMNFI